MNCKNCSAELDEKDSFCSECGGKIIRDRLTIKNLLSNLLDALGWDSNFIVTIRYLLFKPQVVLQEYIDGTRKKYANPFGFFAIIIAISLFVFSQYSEQFIEMSANLDMTQSETLNPSVSTGEQEAVEKEFLGYKNQAEFRRAIGEFQMKYYNFMAFLLLPLYTLLAFIVFRKPYNFGEHLVINTYIQGMVTLLGLLLFVLSLLSGVNLIGSGILVITFLYYCYVYKKLYQLKFGQLIVKILKFIGILLGLGIISVVIGIAYAMITKVK